jgi:hypothetical protein
MATPRTQQAHQKRVDKIVADAAEQIAADSPVDEEVVVTVEELPPGEAAARRAGAHAGAEDLTDTVLQSAAKGQHLAADGINAWVDGMTNAFNVGEWTSLMDPKSMVERSFGFAQQMLAMQKDFALKLADLVPVGQ